VWDPGEIYTETWNALLHDTNRNGRYDAFTDTRYIEYAVGSLAAGASGNLTYDVVASGDEGNPIVSRGEGAIIPAAVGGMKYSGYSIWCENRMQAGTVTPEKLVGMISRPVTILQPVITGKNLQPERGQNVKLEIGYQVKGTALNTLQDYVLTITVPKPLTVLTPDRNPGPSSTIRTGMVTMTDVGDDLRPLRGYMTGELTPTITPRANDTLVVFKLSALPGGRTGAVGLELQLPQDLPKSLFDAKGNLKVKSFDVRAEMSHKTVGTTVVTPKFGPGDY
jgi:hypothetical protein